MGSDWRTAKLSDVYEFRSGLSKPRTAFGTGFPFLTFKDVFYNTFTPEILGDLVVSTEREREQGSVLRGDVFLTRTSETQDELGMSCVALRDYRDATFNGFCKRLRPKRSNEILPEYAGYYFRSPSFRRAVTAMSSLSTRASLNEEMLERLAVVLPSLATQRAIADVLKSLDDKIELNRKTNETLEAMARTLFKSWFVDFDPVRAKAEGRAPSGMDAATVALFPSEFVESALGPIPERWSATPVYDIAKYVNGAAYKAFEPNDERRGLPIIKIAELKAGVTAQTKFSDVSMPEKYRLRTGDILFSWSGNPDTSIDTFIWAHGDAWLNQHIFRVDLHSPNDRSFVLATLKYLRPAFAEIARNKQTTGLGHVTAGDMQRLLVVNPDAGVLTAWERLVSPLFAATFRNELESLTLARVRDELLPRLLSGEVSVTHGERLAAQV